MEILFSLRWGVELVLQNRTLSLCSKIFHEVFGEEPALQCRGQYFAPDSSSLKPGSGATEGALDYGGLRTAGLYPLAGLLDYEDTRLKTSSRVWWDSPLRGRQAWQLRYVDLLCNRLYVTLAPSGVYINQRV